MCQNEKSGFFSVTGVYVKVQRVLFFTCCCLQFPMFRRKKKSVILFSLVLKPPITVWGEWKQTLMLLKGPRGRVGGRDLSLAPIVHWPETICPNTNTFIRENHHQQVTLGFCSPLFLKITFTQMRWVHTLTQWHAWNNHILHTDMEWVYFLSSMFYNE